MYKGMNTEAVATGRHGEAGLKNQCRMDFPGSAVVKNPLANSGDTGLSPGLGDHAAEQLSPCATTIEAHVPRANAPQQEKPPQLEKVYVQQ